MNIQIAIMNWRKLDNEEIMGSEIAYEARQIADFLESLYIPDYDRHVSKRFGRYIEGLLRGYQFCRQEYEGLQINTTLDLHNIVIDSMTLDDFNDWLKEKWASRIMYYYSHEK